MKMSSHSTCSSTSSFTSSSSSCEVSESYVTNHLESQPEKPISKRARKTNNNNNNNNSKSRHECQNASSPSSSRRSSIYRGVTRHRWTGRFEAHLWDKSSWNNVQNKKGKQVYLGAYDNEEAAARTYDLAALKYWGPETILNFPIETYTKELEEMQKVTKEEYLASLRRQSSGFSRGVSKYRGVARHHHNGRWEARIGRVFGNKYLYLGTYSTQEEAAEAYDMAAIEYRGPNAVTNFDISNYIDRLKMKGIPLDNILKEPTLANSPVNETELAQVDELSNQSWLQPQPLLQPEQKLQQQNQLQEIEAAPLHVPHCVDTSMEPIVEHEMDWSMFLDVGLNPVQMPELPIESSCELSDLFNNAGFEEDLDLIFGTCQCGNVFEANQPECVFDNSGCGVEEVGVSGCLEVENGKTSLLLASSSPNSPASSTIISSVSSNYYQRSL